MRLRRLRTCLHACLRGWLQGWLLGLLLCSLASTAAAQAVWRCGPDGRLFSDRPCADGQAYTVADRRSAEDVQAATLLAQRERRLAEQLADERRARAQAAGSGLIGIGPQQDNVPWVRKPRRAGTDKVRVKPGQASKLGQLEREKRADERFARSPGPAGKDLKPPPRPQRPR